MTSSDSNFLSSWRLGLVITCLFFGAFLIALDTNIVGVAVPKISSDFNALGDIAWYGSAYLLTITAFQPTLGCFYSFFEVDSIPVGTILSAAAVNSQMFIVGRAIAGLGAAGILQGALCIIGYAVELSKRPFYMSIVISVFVISVCVGPILGGVLTTRTTWRWCFWMYACPGAIDGEDRFNADPSQKPTHWSCGHDIPANLSASQGNRKREAESPPEEEADAYGHCAITCLVLALQWGGQSMPWKSSTVIGLFAGSGILDSFYLPFYFQAVQGVDPITSGLRFIPLMLPQMVALILTGIVVPFIILGQAICLAGTVLLTRLKPETPTVLWAASLVVTGIGMGMAMQLPYTAIQVVLSEHDAPIGNAIAVFFWQLGGTLSIAAGQTITLTTVLGEVSRRLPDVQTSTIISAGATNLAHAVSSPEVLHTLRSIWNLAVSRTMILSLAAVGASVPFTFGMEWLNARKISMERKERGQPLGSEAISLERVNASEKV
ncbi:MAG: hypothetical protein L6R40_003214 [Gallowayella cf. fulva]|nr:MAG: hypothetical protein L6R40_003214 [Xanthomendoza cf. fulva]